MLPSTYPTASATQIKTVSMLNSSDHTHRYRHFTCTITDTSARLAEIYVLVKLHITGLAPATLCQLAWRTG
ncbi:MAG: hypothetical protein F4199_03640 [Rhodothermaceae bacterium]|nr:hypothetical protein [Rhodothermaceae bacterium]